MNNGDSLAEGEIVSPEILDNILHWSQQLKENNGYPTNPTSENWYLQLCPKNVDESSGYRTQYQNRVRQLKVTQTAFDAMSKTLGQVIRETHMRFYPLYLQEWISSLPNEILAIILGFACEGEDGANPFTLGHVSNRFRQALQAIPRLWTTIGTDMNIEDCRLALRLSRNEPLDVAIVSWESPHSKIEFVAAFFDHKSRWRTCLLDFTHQAFPMVCIDVATMELELPQLRQLAIKCQDPHVISDVDFFEHWHTPALSELKLLNYFPKPILGMSLTRLEVRLKTRSHPRWRLNKLMRLLSACPTLEEFSLSLLRARGRNGEVYEEVQLPQLKKLVLMARVEAFDEWEFPLRPFMEALVTPNLDALKLYVDTFDWRIYRSIIRDVVGRDARLHALKSLDVTVRNVSSENDMIGNLLLKTPRLCNFSFEAPDLCMREVFPQFDLLVRCPPLDTVTLRKCYHATPRFVNGFRERINEARRERDWDDDVKFKFIDCPNLASIHSNDQLAVVQAGHGVGL